MPKPQPQDWSQAYARIQRLADRNILAALRQALVDINRMLREIDPSLGRVGDLVRIEQLQTVKRNLLIEQGKIFGRMGDIIAERRAQAALQATLLGSAIDDVLFGAFGQGATAQQLRNSIAAGLNQTIDVAITRMTVSAVPLAQRIYNSNVWANGVLQKRINSALLRGLSAQEFAKEARSWFDPRVPGGTRYAAMRLARTEINNAFFSTSVLQAQEKPWIQSMKWHLSRSHPKPDTCDQLARGGPKGDGVYPKMEVPRKPHPQCFCFVTPVSPDEDEFLDGLVTGKYDRYLRQKMSGERMAPKVEPKKVETPKVPKVPKARTRPLTGTVAPKASSSPNIKPPTPRMQMQQIYGDRLRVLSSDNLVDQRMENLSRIPDRHHKLVAQHFRNGSTNSGIWIGRGGITDLSPESFNLKGLQPRGWPAGSTFDDVAGVYMPGNRQLLIGNKPHGCVSLSNHEFGHALDDAAGKLSDSHDFRVAATKITHSKAFSVTPYMNAAGNPTGWTSEFFAEGYGGWSMALKTAKSEGEMLLAVANSLGYARWDLTLRASQRAEAALEPHVIEGLRDLIRLYERIG